MRKLICNVCGENIATTPCTCRQRAKEACKLCRGSGKNTTGLGMKVNTHQCPRCSGSSSVPKGYPDNSKFVTVKDKEKATLNGWVGPLE